MSDSNCAAALEALLQERILVLDGAMGTMIQAHDLGRRSFAAPRPPTTRSP